MDVRCGSCSQQHRHLPHGDTGFGDHALRWMIAAADLCACRTPPLRVKNVADFRDPLSGRKAVLVAGEQCIQMCFNQRQSRFATDPFAL